MCADVVVQVTTDCVEMASDESLKIVLSESAMAGAEALVKQGWNKGIRIKDIKRHIEKKRDFKLPLPFVEPSS